MNEEPYDKIIDWTIEGRRALLEERGGEIKWMLYEAATEFVDDPTLKACGFNKSSSPLMEYVEFCLKRFRDGDLDPDHIRPQDRSFRLFTRVNFWLAQKMGKTGFNAHKHKWIADETFDEKATDTPSAAAKCHREFNMQFEAEHQRERFKKRLAETLPIFTRETVPELVLAWLNGTQRFRGYLFATDNLVALPEAWSSSDKSKQIADAMCRFAVCMLGMLDQGQENMESMYTIYARGCCKPYDHKFYYRKLDRTVGNLLGISSTEAKTQRKAAAVSLVESLIATAHRAHKEDNDLLLYAFLRVSLRKSFFDVHSISPEDAEACCVQLDEWRKS